MSKLRVGVIFGGCSSEKEVSLEGGRNIYYKLSEEKYEKIPIFVDSKLRLWQINNFLLVQNTTSDLEALLEEQAKKILYEDLRNMIDFAFVVGHGKYMEDGCFQGFLELQNIPYNGPGVLGSALGMDKHMFRKILNLNGIKVPKYLAVFETDWQKDPEKIKKEIKNNLGFPCLVKPSREGCSTGITVIRDEKMIPRAMEQAFQWDTIALVDEYIENATEITVSVLGNRDLMTLPATETPWQRNLEYLTLHDKFLPGGAEMITPARIGEEMTKKVKETAIKVCQILRLQGYPRIDMFIKRRSTQIKTQINADDISVNPRSDGHRTQRKSAIVPSVSEAYDEIIVLEPNTLPGVTPSTMVFHQAAEIGMSPEQFVDKIIELGLEAHRNKKGPL